MDLDLFLVSGLKNEELISFYYIIVGKKAESKWNNDMTKKTRDFRVKEKNGDTPFTFLPPHWDFNQMTNQPKTAKPNYMEF